MLFSSISKLPIYFKAAIFVVFLGCFFVFLASNSLAQTLPGDLDGDGRVNTADLARLLWAWNSTTNPAADLDRNNKVGPGDLAVLLNNWGKTVSVSGLECSASNCQDPECGACPGNYDFSLLHDKQTRQYQVHVPERYTAPAPLVFVFHPLLGTANYIRSLTGFDNKSDQEGFIAVFPSGLNNSWNGGGCCAYAFNNNIDDVGFVAKMIEDLKIKYNIDSQRIYATGFSNGGMLSHRLAADLPEIFAAVGAAAGARVSLGDGSAVRDVSVLHLNALDDTISTVELADRTVDWWIGANQCEYNRRLPQDQGAYCELYNCRNGRELRYCLTQDGGHSWPGGTKPGSSTAINATDLVWDFFKNNAK